MGHGYDDSSHDECPWQELDEFLCEYVDGSMDPVVKEAFEEYLSMDPELAEHVDCLCAARRLLCNCWRSAPGGFQERLRRRLAVEELSSRRVVFPGVAERLGTIAAFTSVLVLATVFGMVFGAQLTPTDLQDHVPLSKPQGSQESVELPAVRYAGFMPGNSLPALEVETPPRYTPLPVYTTIDEISREEAPWAGPPAVLFATDRRFVAVP